MTLIPRGHRAYVESHPLGLLVSIGLGVSGLINLILPSLIHESAAYVAFPSFLFYSYSLCAAVGGSMSTWGLLKGKRKLEAAGMALLAGALAANYIAVIAIRPSAALSSIFIPALAAGCARRARHLTRSGYVNLTLPAFDR